MQFMLMAHSPEIQKNPQNDGFYLKTFSLLFIIFLLKK